MNLDGKQENEGQDSFDVEQLAMDSRMRWDLIENLVLSMQLQYEMIQLHERNRNAFPSVLDARIIKDFRDLKQEELFLMHEDLMSF